MLFEIRNFDLSGAIWKTVFTLSAAVLLFVVLAMLMVNLFRSQFGQPYKRLFAVILILAYALWNYDSYRQRSALEEWGRAEPPVEYRNGKIDAQGIYVPQDAIYGEVDFCTPLDLAPQTGCRIGLMPILLLGFFEYVEYGAGDLRRMKVLVHDPACRGDGLAPRKFEKWILKAQDICYISEEAEEILSPLALNAQAQPFPFDSDRSFLTFTLTSRNTGKVIDSLDLWRHEVHLLPRWFVPNTRALRGARKREGPLCDLLNHQGICVGLERSSAFTNASKCEGECFGKIVVERFGIDEARLLLSLRSSNLAEANEGLQAVCRFFRNHVSEEFEQAFVAAGNDPTVAIAESIKNRAERGNCL